MHERTTVVMTIENYRIVRTGTDTYRLEYKRRFRFRDLFKPARRWKRIHIDFNSLPRLKVVLFNYADKKNKH